MNLKVRRFVSFSLSAVLAAGTLIGVATPAHAADYMRGYSNTDTRAGSNATLLYTTFTYKNQLLFLTRVTSNTALVVAKPDGTTTTLMSRVTSSNDLAHAVLNGNLYLALQDYTGGSSPYGTELYKYDGSTLTRVGDWNNGSANFFGSSSQALTFMNNELWFFGSTGSTATTGLYHWDGLASSPTMVPGTAGLAGSYVTALGGNLYFQANRGMGFELYKFDGTSVSLAANIASDTSAVTDSIPSPWNASTSDVGTCMAAGRGSNFPVANNYLFFYARPTGATYYNLYAVSPDGTVTTVVTTTSVTPSCPVEYDNAAYFVGSLSSNSNGVELYKWTGVGSSPTLAVEIVSGSGGIGGAQLSVWQNKLYIYDNESPSRVRTWVAGAGSTAAATSTLVTATGSTNDDSLYPINGSGTYGMGGLAWMGGFFANVKTSLWGTQQGLFINFDSAPPVLAAIPNKTVSTGVVSIEAPTLTSGNSTGWEATGLPAGLVINEQTGVIAGTANTAGTYSVTVKAYNNNYASPVEVSSQTFSLTLAASAPSLPATRTVKFVSGSANSFPVANFNTGGLATTYTATSLPAGLSINSTTGVISGTATTLGTADFTVTASNADGSSSMTLTATVIPKPLLYSSTNSVQTATTCTINAACTIMATPPVLTETSGLPLTYSSTNLPAGVSLDANTGALSGTLTSLMYLTPIVVSVTDGYSTATFSKVVNVYDIAPVISSYGPLNLPQSSAVSGLTLPATTGGTPLQYSTVAPAITGWTYTNLPAGLSSSSTTGLITGTPTTPGTYSNVTVKAYSYGNVVSNTVTFTINVTAVAPVFSYSAMTCVAKSACSSKSPTVTAGTVTSYSITPALPSGMTFNTTTGAIGGTPADNTQQLATDYTVTGTNSVGSYDATVSITVNDYAPTCTAVSTVNVTAFELMTPTTPITCTAGHVTSYSIEPGYTLPTGLSINPSTGEITGTPTTTSANVKFRATVLGGNSTTTSAITAITVQNVAPVLNPISDVTSSAFAYMNTVTPTGKWLSGINSFSCAITNKPSYLSINSSTCVITGTGQGPAAPSGTKVTVPVTVTATNTFGSSTQTFNTYWLPSKPIWSNSGWSIQAAQDAFISQAPPGTSGAGTPGWFSVTPDLPAGLTLNTTTGYITGTPTVGQASTNYTMTVGNDGGSSSTTITIGVLYKAPTFASSTYAASQSFTFDQSVSINAPTHSSGTSSTGSPPTSWSITPALPTGLTFNTTTGAITGTPTGTTNFGPSNYTVKATNSVGTYTFSAFPLSISLVKPTFAAVSAQSIGRGVPYSLTFANSGSRVSLCTKTAGTLPAGISLSLVNGQCVLSGTPTTITTASSVSFTGTNQSGASTTLTFDIGVIDVPPVLASVPTQSLTQGVAYSLAAPANTGGTITSWSISSGALPAGVTLASDGSITGTPTTAGQWSATLQATNSGGSATTQLSGTVAEVFPPGLTNPGTHYATLGQAMSFTIANTGSAATFVVTSGTLPTGFTLNTSTGEISGTSNTEQASRSITINATNYTGTDSVTFSMGVVQPVAVLAAISPISIKQGLPYSLNALSNSGGVITSWAASNLPAGLTINTTTGVISGTPTSPQSTTDAQITATTTGGDSSQTISFEILALIPPSLGSVTDKVFTMGDPQSFTIPNSGDEAVFAVSSGVLPSGFTLNSATGVISGVGSADDSERSITVTATNYTGSSATTFKMTVKRAPPILDTTTPAQVLNKGSAYSLSAISNTGGLVATWSATGLPAGISIDTNTGAISGTPTTVSGAANATITATNSGGTASVQVSFQVDPALTPVLASPGDQTLTVGSQNYSLQIVNTGGDGVWTVSAGTLPAGLSINSVTGEITGIPSAEESSHAVTIKVTNPSGANDSVTFNFTIQLPIPSFASATSHTYLQGDAVTLLPPTNTGGAVATWAASGLPAGLSINSSTGLISGTVSTPQSTSDATITAINSGGSVNYVQSFTVTAMALPSLASIADVRLTINTSYTLQFTNSGYTSTWSATGLPTGFSIDQTTGDITGSSSVEVASRQVTITAQNYAGTDSKTFAFAVVQPIPVISAISTQTLTRGSAASISSPTNTGGPVTSWSATGLPLGLTINSATGEITGTPTTLQSATDATITATNSGGTASRVVSITVNDVAPSLGVLGAITLTKGSTMTAVSAPANSGGAILNWSSNDLPAGLAINSSTGEITGTPTSLQAATNATITATNSGGSGSTTISITVNDVVPSLGSLSAITLTKGSAMTAVSAPANSGGAIITWSSTNLPAGLSINASTGEITGTPTALQASTNSTIRATNSGGFATTTIAITVNDVAPNLGSLGAITLSKGSAITAIARPSNSGGDVITWSSTDLPAGLSINSATGQITGTPTAIQVATDSTIKAENSGGFDTATISITINDQLPVLGIYQGQGFIKGTPISFINPPANTGGAVISWAATGLPNGVTINSSTGVITGTPTSVVSQTTATITATNSGGSVSVSLSYEVIDKLPVLGTITAQVFTKGTAITPIQPPTVSNTGGDVVSWGISGLPPGLTIDSSTGVITGTPTAVRGQATYYIEAINSGGITQVPIEITVNDVIPNLGSMNAVTLVNGIQMTKINAPSNSGGDVVTWSATNLPTGVSIDRYTGEITGTPTVLRSATTSTITATNSGGAATTTISITVIDTAPILGTLPAITLSKNVAMTPVAAPANTGGLVVTWSSSDLPSGISIDAATGEISGTPTGFQAATTSHITGTNSGGSATTTISITINDSVPQLVPFANPFYFTNGVAITPFTATNNGGVATSWSAVNLPNGLTINTATGEVSGTPIGLDAGHSATIYATNTGGGHAVTFSYFVNAVIPNLGSMSSVTVNKGVEITPINPPTNTGGAVVTWTTTGLPAGLTINSSTGQITGTPNTVASAATFTITGTNSGGSASATISITVADSAPGAPTITSISSTNQKLTVNFSTGSNVGTSITKYQYSTDGGLTWRDRATGTTASPIEITSISGVANTPLVNSTSYDIQIRAFNTIVGAATSTRAATPNDLPSSPSNVTATLSGTTAQITWTAATGAVDSYTVTSNVGNFSCTVNAPATSCFIYGLSNGTTYTFTVTSTNNAGTSSSSSATSSITPDLAPGAPSITGITISNQQMSVAFVAGSNMGSAITKYQYSTDGGSTWHDRDSGTTSSPLVITTISGAGNSALVNGTSYNVQIRAFNTKEGTASGTTTATPDVAPGAPSIDSLTPGNGSLSIAFTTGANSGSAVVKYQYTTDGSNYKDLVGTTSPITISTISGIANTSLANGSEYTIRIRAINTLAGAASSSASGIPDVRPGSPTITSITSSDSQLSLAFTAASNSGSAITKYQYSTDGGSTWHDRASGTGSPLVISRRSDTNSSLVNGTTYSIALRAVNTLNGVASVAVDGTPDMIPQTIRDLVVTSADGKIDLSWTAPLGTPINDYVIQYSSDNGVTFTTYTHNASTANSISVTGLANGTAYMFRIYVLNGTSISEPIVSSTVTPRANQAPLNWGMADTSLPYLGTLTLSTTGGSGTGEVVYSVTGSASCVIAGNILTAGEVGSSCVITATKQMAGPYNAASTSSRTISVTKIAQANTISFTSGNTVQFGNTLTVKAVGGSGPGTISYSVVNAGSTGCSIDANTGELNVAAAGTCRVGAARGTSNNYRDYLADYSLPTQDITVTRANQTISFTSVIPTNPLAGDTYPVAGNSSAGLQLAFSIDSGACTISNDVVTFTASGVCVIKGSQAGDGQYSGATDVYQTVTVGQRNQVLTYSASTLAKTTVTYGDPTFLVTASSTEATAMVTFTLNAATTNSACLVTTEGLVSVLAVGICAVQADAAGTSAFAAASPIIQTIYVLPAPAGAPFITSIAGGNQAITMNFTAPSYDGGSSITGFQLVAIPQTAGYDTVFESGCSTATVNDEATCTVRGLRNGVHYKMKVAALTSAGLGTYSELSRSLQVATNPSAVQTLRVNQSNAQLVISWSDPESLGGGTFDSYRIFIKMSAAANYDSVNFFEVRDDTIHTFTATKVSPTGANLANGVAYDIKVVTVTTANSVELSANTAVVNQIPRTVPGAPRFNNAIIMGSDVVLIWQSPISDGGAEISEYTAQVASSTCVLDNPADTFCTAPKPVVGGSYQYNIKAFNIAGASDPATGSVQLGTTPPPVIVPPTTPTVDTPAVIANPDDVDGGEVSEEIERSSAIGDFVFADESGITIDRKGVIKPRIKSGYIGKIRGRVTVQYADASGVIQTFTCKTTFKFGTTKKNKKAKILPSTNWFPKKWLKSKKGCKLPPAVFKGLQTAPVSITGRFWFVRLWPVTAKPIRANGSRIQPIWRTMKVKIKR